MKILIKLLLTGLMFLFAWLGGVQAQELTIGSGTTQGQSLPVDPYFGFTYSQSIYLQSSIGYSGNITSLKFYLPATANIDKSNKWTIWMGHTTKTSFTSATDWIAVSSLTQVFTGIVANSSGVVTITLSTSFNYNNTENLVIAIDENATEYNSINDRFYVHNAPSNSSIHYRSDSNNPNPSAPPDASARIAFRPNITFVGIGPSCTPPNTLSGAPTSPTTANLSWIAPSPAPGSGYDWEVRSSGAGGSGPTGLAASGSVVAGVLTASATGLTGGTNYTLYVRSNCGGGDYSAWAASAAFSTPCTATTVPYTQDFESITPPAIPACTQVVQGGTGNLWVTTAAPGSGFTTKSLKYAFNSSNAANTWYFIRGLNLTGGTSYRLTYNYGNNSVTYTEKMKVAYGTAATIAAMTNPLADHPTINQNAIQSNTVYFTPASTAVYYIGFQAYSATDQLSLYLDNIAIDISPNCIEPTVPSGTPTSPSAATINWIAPSPAPSGYEYAVTTSATPPGSGTAFAGTSTTVSGLAANTTYYLHVRSDCGGSEFSVWATSPPFKTPCDAVTAFAQNWDGVTAPALPDCYYKVGSLGLVMTQPLYASSSPNTLYLYAGTQSSQPTLALQPVSNAGANTHWLRLKLRGDITAGEVLQVGYLTDPNNASSFVLLQEFTAASLTYTEYFCDPGVAPGSNQVLALRAKGIAAASMLVDDLVWEPKPSCLAPTAISCTPTSSTTADISWTPPSPAPSGGYEYAVTTSAMPPASGTAFAGTNTSVSGLTVETTYYLHVRSDCGGSEFSVWATSPPFKTPCDAVTAFAQNWDGVTAPALPDCYYKVGSLGSVKTQASSASSSPNTLYLYATSQSAQPTLALQPVSNAGANTHWLRFKLRANFTVGDVLQVGYLTDPNNASSFVQLQEFTAASLTYTEYICDPGTAPGSNQVLALRAKSIVAGSMLVDDLEWEPKPSCLAPTAISCTPTSSSTADISWTAPSPAPSNGYQYAVTTSATPPGSGTAFAGTSTSVSGLTANTTYYLHVRSDCGGSGYSTWATSAAFKTPCDAASIPFFEGFESGYTDQAAVGGCWSQEAVTGTNPWTANSTLTDYNRTPRTGSFNAYLRYDNERWLFYPVTLTGGTTYAFSVYARQDGSISTDASITLAYGTAPSNAGMTNTVVNTQSIIDGNYQEVTGNFTPALSGNYYIGIKGKINGNPWYISLDDISVTVVFICLPPTALSGTPTSPTTANISWTVPSPAPSIGYEYAVTTSATPPGSGTAFAGTSTTVSGLAANTTYYLHVRSDCSGSGYSTWATSAAFYTGYCQVSTTYSDDYLSLVKTTGATTDVNYTASSQPSGSYSDQTSQTFEAYAGQSFDFNTTYVGGGNGVKIWIDWNNDLTFDDMSEVWVSSYDNNSSQTFNVTVPGAMPNGTYRVRVRGQWGALPPQCGNVNYGSTVDFILTLINPPSCTSPTSLTGTPTGPNTANLSWTAPVNPPSNGYEWVVDQSPSDPAGSGTAEAGTSATVSGLTGNTTYYLHVRSNCGGGDYSSWATSAEFTTPCDTQALPWTEGFEGVTIPAFPDCWYKENGTWVTTNNDSSPNDANAHSGTQFLRAHYNSNNDYMWTPGFNLSAGTSYDFSFWWAGDNFGGWDADLFMNGSQSSSGATLVGNIVSNTTYTTKTYAKYTYTFTPASSGTYYFGIRSKSNGNGWYLSFDDFSMKQTPTCLPPTAVTVSSLDETTVGLDWTPPVPPPSNGYEYELRASGAAGSGPTGLVNSGTVSGSSISVSGLTAGTQYTFYIRSDCTEIGYSTWAASNAFTPIGCINFTQAPANGATDMSVDPIQFDWTTVPGMASYDFYWKDITPPTILGNYNLAPPIVFTPNFAAEPFGQTFYWKIEPKATDGSKAIPACAIQSLTYEANPLPGSCVSSPNGKWPTSTFVPTCTGTTQNITTAGYAGEYSLVTLTAGLTYTFTSSIGTDIITIGAPITPVATGTGSVTYTPAVSGNYRFYTHIAGCGSQNSNRTRSVACVVVNNECPGSINLTPVAGKFTDPGTQSLASATLSGVSIPIGCPGTYVRDMWYKLTTDNDGNVNEDFTVSVTPAAGVDIGLALYDGSCGSLTALACNDLAAAGISETITWTDPFTGGNIEIRGNKTYYVRVMLTSGSTAGTFTINAGGPALPVNLISFTARAINGKQVGLNWNVAAESLLDGYVVEHSTDGRSFEAIGKVKAAQKSAYAFVHDNPAQGVNYYRLRMLDDNGAFKLSEVRQVVFANGRALSLYPNPTSGLVYVSGLEGVKNGAYVNIYNEMGISVFSGKIGGDELASKGIDMSMYAPGAYVIRVISDEVNTTMRFVKE